MLAELSEGVVEYLLDRDWNRPIALSDPAVEVLDSRFRQYVGSATLERLWTGGHWTEALFGLVTNSVCSDIPNDRILAGRRLTVRQTCFVMAPTTPTAILVTGKRLVM